MVPFRCRRASNSEAVASDSIGPRRPLGPRNRPPIEDAVGSCLQVAAAVQPRPTGWIAGRAAIGQTKTYDEQAEKRVLALLDCDPPKGYSQWNGRPLAQSLGDVSDDQAWHVLRSTRSNSSAAAVGVFTQMRSPDRKQPTSWDFYLSPPGKAIVLCGMRNRTYRRWKERRVGCGCPMGKP